MRKPSLPFSVLSVLAVLSASTVPTLVHAGPQDGTVAAGSASISSLGNATTIIQSTDRAVINWRGFDVAAHEVVTFVQPSSSAITLNRVNSSSASLINGTVRANGNIVLINPNGILFGAGSVIDVNSLIATTADIGDSKFMAGSLAFDKAGSPTATIENRGTLTAKEGGLVGLVAPNVLNSGVINAKLGRALLASGETFTVDMYGDGLLEVAASSALTSQLVRHTGTINAEGGTIALTAAAAAETVNSLIDVQGSLKATAIGTKNGNIYLYAEGSNAVTGNVPSDKGTRSGQSVLAVSGKLDVSSSSGTGGEVTITADKVILKNQTTINASGRTGGGTIKIGGDGEGKGKTPAAVEVAVEKEAILDASATEAGDGGNIVLWSDGLTMAQGTLWAKGGALGGNGGLVETSGKTVDFTGIHVSTTSVHGRWGTWLIDPTNITIDAAAASAIGLALGSNNVAIVTSYDGSTSGGYGSTSAGNGNIRHTASAITAAGAGSLSFSAYHDIVITSAITLNGGSLTLRADNNKAGAGSVSISGAIATNGGAITIGGGDGAISAVVIDGAGAIVTPASGYAVGDASYASGVTIASILDAGGGNIIVNGQGYNGSSGANGVFLNSGSLQTNGNGTISISGIGVGSAGTTSSGVKVDGTSTIRTENGSVSLYGKSLASGGSSSGVLLYPQTGTAFVGTTGNGSIYMTGEGSVNSTGGSAVGVGVRGNIVVSATGGGSLVIKGTGGGDVGTANYNYGSIFDHAAQVLVSGGGSMWIWGKGGSGAGVGNSGVVLQSAGTKIENRRGDIAITGIAGGGSGVAGVYADSANQLVTTTSGNISIIADIVNFSNVSTVDVVSAGSVTLTPYTSGATMCVGLSTGCTFNMITWKIAAISANSFILGSASTGNITLNTSADFGNADITFISGGQINLAGNLARASGTSAVTYTFDAAGSITNSNGAGLSSSSGPVNVVFNSNTDGSGSEGITLSGATVSTKGGDLTFSDPLSIGSASVFALGGGRVTVSGAMTLNANLTINDGGGNNNLSTGISGTGGLIKDGSGVLTLSGLDTHTGTTTVNAGSLLLSGAWTVGGGTATAVVASGATFGGSGVITSSVLDLSGGGAIDLTGSNKIGTLRGTGTQASINFNNAQSLALDSLTTSGSLSISTSGNLTVNTGKVLSSAASGNAVVLAADGAFTNNAGSGAIMLTGSGRWLVYSANSSGNAFGNLDSGNTALWGATPGVHPPSSVTATGNRYIFAYQPVLTVASTDASVIYGNTPGLASSYTITGYSTGVTGAFRADSSSTALSGTPSLNSAGATVAADVGSYAITVGSGTLTSTSGYALTYVNGGVLTVDPATVVATLTGPITKTYDGNATAALTPSHFALSGLYGSDDVSIAATSGTYASRSVGINIPVTVSGLVLSGAKASNYVLASTHVSGPVGTIVAAPPQPSTTTSLDVASLPTTVVRTLMQNPIATVVAISTDSANQSLLAGRGTGAVSLSSSQTVQTRDYAYVYSSIQSPSSLLILPEMVDLSAGLRNLLGIVSSQAR